MHISFYALMTQKNQPWLYQGLKSSQLDRNSSFLGGGGWRGSESNRMNQKDQCID